MENLSLVLPALYGDHHVASVQRVLKSLPGVSDVTVSPAAHAVSLQFDYATGDPEPILPVPGPGAPRHTATLAGILAFAHEPPAWEGRPLWPCPGFDRPTTPEH
jgi:copper chaperone CopZ